MDADEVYCNREQLYVFITYSAGLNQSPNIEDHYLVQHLARSDKPITRTNNHFMGDFFYVSLVSWRTTSTDLFFSLSTGGMQLKRQRSQFDGSLSGAGNN